MQTKRAKRMDSAGEEASLNSPELPWNQLYLKRRTESRIPFRRRVCFTGPAAAAAAVIGVLAILILAADSVSSDSESVKVSISVKCTEGQDCILSCSFNYTAGGWNETSRVIWRQAETHDIVHSSNTDRLAAQFPQYVSRTSLFDSELQRGNASLLLRTVREKDAGNYSCSVYTPGGSESSLIEVVVVPADNTTAPAQVKGPDYYGVVGLVGLGLIGLVVFIIWKTRKVCSNFWQNIKHARCCCWNCNNAPSRPSQEMQMEMEMERLSSGGADL